MGPIEKGVRREIRKLPTAERTGALAMMALHLAIQLDDPESEASLRDLAPLSRELRATLADLAKFEDVKAKGGKVDELTAARKKRRANAG